MRIVIIGGGIVGMASAYELAHREVDVVVLERSNIGAGNTERSAGGIRTQFASEENVTLAKESIDTWGRFEAEFGEDIDFRRTGYLFVTSTEETAKQFRQNVETQRALGVDNEFLEPAEAKAVCPGLRTDAITGGAYSPTDGLADPHLALQAYANAAREAGVDIRLHTAVTALEDTAQREMTVATNDEPLEADFVVNAAGVWGGKIAEMAGLELPVTPERLGLAVVDPEVPVAESVPMTLNPNYDCYFHPERDGRAFVGGGPELLREDSGSDPDAFSTALDMAFATEAVERAGEYTTYFGPESRIQDGWTGAICSTPDHDPIIEETIPGFVNVIGFSGHGFMLAPAVGKLVADLVVDGDTALVDISAYASDRFTDDDADGHRWVSA